MVPAMDTFMKSFQVLSQMSEGEDGGRIREREEMKWVKKRGAQKSKHTNGQNAERHKLNDAQWLQQATLWQSPDRRQVFNGKNRILVVLQRSKERRDGGHRVE